MSKSKLPIACSLTDREFRERREGILAEIKGNILQTTELKNGFIFSFPKEAIWIRKVAEMIMLERECCPFIDFKLSVGADSDELKLSMTGRKGTKEFVSSLFL